MDESIPEEKKGGAPLEAGGEEEQAGAIVVSARVDRSRRFGAYIVDSALALGPATAAGMVLGPLFGYFLSHLAQAVLYIGGAHYMLHRDSLSDGASYGKRLFGLRVVNARGQQCSPVESVRRNLLLGAPVVASAFLHTCLLFPVASFVAIMLLIPLSGILSLGVLFEGLQVLVLDKDGKRLTERRAACFTIQDS